MERGGGLRKVVHRLFGSPKVGNIWLKERRRVRKSGGAWDRTVAMWPLGGLQVVAVMKFAESNEGR
jgi:hypothetical protein